LKFTFYNGPVLDVEFEEPLAILEIMNMFRIVIGGILNHYDTEALPPTHKYMNPILITLSI